MKSFMMQFLYYLVRIFSSWDESLTVTDQVISRILASLTSRGTLGKVWTKKYFGSKILEPSRNIPLTILSYNKHCLFHAIFRTST